MGPTERLLSRDGGHGPPPRGGGPDRRGAGRAPRRRGCARRNSSAGGASVTRELLVERGGDGVATVTFNRPETLNALTFEGYRALRDTFRGFAGEPGVRAVVLTG